MVLLPIPWGATILFCLHHVMSAVAKALLVVPVICVFESVLDIGRLFRVEKSTPKFEVTKSVGQSIPVGVNLPARIPCRSGDEK